MQKLPVQDFIVNTLGEYNPSNDYFRTRSHAQFAYHFAIAAYDIGFYLTSSAARFKPVSVLITPFNAYQNAV
jgi:hypothetical protein